MNATVEKSDDCPNCIKAGLAILPVRYAVARDDASTRTRAPRIQAPFGDGVTSIPIPASAASYTLRSMRSGYIYVFNEIRGEWSAYESDDSGRLTAFDVFAKTPPPAEAEGSPVLVCSRHGDSPLARAILIPDAAGAGRVWIGFSQVAWTQAVLSNHRSESVRKKHMRCIDVRGWVSGKGAKTQPHLCSLDRVSEVVAEYAVAPAPAEDGAVNITAYQAFRGSPQEFRERKDDVEELQSKARAAGERWGYPPAIIALDDPTGIAMELAGVADHTLVDFLRSKSNARPLAVSRAIANIRQAIQADAENHQIYKTEADAIQMLDGGLQGDPSPGMEIARALFPRLRKEREELYEKWRDPTPEQIFKARRDAWAKYGEKYDENARLGYEKEWNEALKAFESDITTPLANSHAAWMSSSALMKHLDCNCDPENAESGLSFLEQVTMCIRDTQQYSPCFGLYSKWLEASTIEQSNLLLRAMGYNQKAVLDKLNSVAKGGLQASALKGLSWDALIGGYDAALAPLKEGKRDVVARLALAVGGPIAKLVGSAIDRGVGPGLIALGLIAKSPIVSVEVTMSKTDAIRELITRMTAANPKVAQLKDLRTAIDIEMRKSRIYGTPVKGTGKLRYLILADKRVVEDFPGMNSNMTARNFAKGAILTEAEHARLTNLRWKGLFSGSVRTGVLAGIFQVVALTKLADDVDSSMAHELNENRRRYATGMAALVGTLTETAGKWSESASAAGSRLAARLEVSFGRWLRVGGKALGMGAGVVMAIWDVMRSVDEFQEGNNTVGWLYVGSAVGSVGAVVAFSTLGPMIFGAAATGVGIAFVVVVILIALAIEIFKDNKIEDWLERCHYGRLVGEKYQDPEIEMKELELALAG